MPVRPLLVSRWWVQGAGLTYLVGFAILGVLAYLTYAEQPPIPARVVDPAGAVLFTREDVLGGMNVFQRRGLMEYGSVYGHGAYLGPDFTAEWLHAEAAGLRSMRERAEEIGGRLSIEPRRPRGTQVTAWLPVLDLA